MKKIISMFLIIIVFFINSIRVHANNIVYVSGDSIGLKMNSYVEVLGTYGINDGKNLYTPWLDKIFEHDLLISLNSNKIKGVKDLDCLLQENKDNNLTLTIKRDDKMVDEIVKPAFCNGKYSLGLYVKDYDLGIGTMTFALDNLKYASLGHKMIDNELFGGNIYYSSITEIIKPHDGKPGEKRATIGDKSIGSITSNLQNGVYGYLYESNSLKTMRKMEILDPSEVKVGYATILTAIKKDKVEEFDVEIKQVLKQDSNGLRGIKVKVTDKRLIESTGGIVQGMSGSPIIQNGKLVGALSHVTLNDSTIGYGVYASFMLNQMN